MLPLIMILVICLLIIILWRIYRKNKYVLIEGIDSQKSTMGSPAGSTTKKKFSGTFSGTYNGHMATNDQYYYDKTFDNVVYYPNKYTEDSALNDIVENGWTQCKQSCEGNCIEFGVSGASYCFSP